MWPDNFAFNFALPLFTYIDHSDDEVYFNSNKHLRNNNVVNSVTQ